jgi:hypothetical protein
MVFPWCFALRGFDLGQREAANDLYIPSPPLTSNKMAELVPVIRITPRFIILPPEIPSFSLVIGDVLLLYLVLLHVSWPGSVKKLRHPTLHW